MIKIKKIDYLEIIQRFDLSSNLYWIENEYLAERNGRSDIFKNLDIFYENVRSITKHHKNFDFFSYSDKIESDTVIVIGLYLELLEYWGKNNKIKEIIESYSKEYDKNLVVFYWNHDADFAKYNYIVKNLSNVIILNYNTSEKTKNDIVLPFWTHNIDDQFKIINYEDKTVFCNMICSLNNSLRINLYNILKSKNEYYVKEKLSFDEFKKIISKSIFTLCPRGQGLSSYRFFESIMLGSIPVLFADKVVLPYEDEIDYNSLIIRIPENKSTDFNYINDTLKNSNYKEMLNNIKNNIDLFKLSGIQSHINNNILKKNK